MNVMSKGEEGERGWREGRREGCLTLYKMLLHAKRFVFLIG